MRVALLGLDVDRFIVIFGIDDDWKKQPLRICARESRVPVGAPLHGCTHPCTVAEIDVVAHSDLVAVIDDRRAGKGEKQSIQKLDSPAVIVHERSEAAPNAQIDSGLRIDAYVRHMCRGLHPVTISRVSSSWFRRKTAH